MDKIAETVSILVEKALDINATEMVIQIASTLLLFAVVKIFFWEKITAFIEARQEFMSNELNQATEAHDEAELLKETANKELNDLRLSAKGIVEEAKSRGEVERKTIISKAKDEASYIRENSRKEIDSEIEKARENINEEIVSVAVLMAEKVLNKEIDATKHKELINDVLSEVTN